MLLHRNRIVRAALDRRVVGHNQHFTARDAANARDDARPWGGVIVHARGGKWRELEERRLGIEQQTNPFTDGKLALVTMALQILRAATFARAAHAIAKVRNQALHAITIGLE